MPSSLCDATRDWVTRQAMDTVADDASVDAARGWIGRMGAAPNHQVVVDLSVLQQYPRGPVIRPGVEVMLSKAVYPDAIGKRLDRS